MCLIVVYWWYTCSWIIGCGFGSVQYSRQVACARLPHSLSSGMWNWNKLWSRRQVLLCRGSMARAGFVHCWQGPTKANECLCSVLHGMWVLYFRCVWRNCLVFWHHLRIVAAHLPTVSFCFRYLIPMFFLKTILLMSSSVTDVEWSNWWHTGLVVEDPVLSGTNVLNNFVWKVLILHGISFTAHELATQSVLLHKVLNGFAIALKLRTMLCPSIPSKLCACARAHSSWDERTQERVERTYNFPSITFYTYFMHVDPNTNESRWNVAQRTFLHTQILKN